MRREQTYLPSLNSLYRQQRYKQYHEKGILKHKPAHLSQQGFTLYSKEQHEKHRRVLDLSRKDSQTLSLDQSKRRSCSEMARREELSPFQKKKMRERDQENNRLYVALNKRNTVDTGNAQSSAEHQFLKNKIRKYTQEGNTVVYKFKKSLIEMSKRKKRKSTDEGSTVLYNLKKQLELLQKNIPSLSMTNQSTDIYLNLESRENIKEKQPKGQIKTETMIDKSIRRLSGSQSVMQSPIIKHRTQAGNHSQNDSPLKRSDRKMSNSSEGKVLMSRWALMCKRRAIEDLQVICLPKAKERSCSLQEQ